MSHFAVLVMSKNHGNDVDDLLARYDENISVDPYIDQTREEAIKRVRENALHGLKAWTERLESDPDDADTAKKYIKENKERLTEWTDEQCYQYEREMYDDDMVDENGNLLSTYNPDSKWDWYDVGGRWSGMLRTMRGIKVDMGYAQDLNWNPNKKKYSAAVRWWEINVEDAPLKDGEEKDKWMFYKPEYYKEFYHDKKTYATIRSLPIFRSVVTPDGEWYEKGKMGWWGMSSESGSESLDWDLHFMERFIAPAIEGNWYVTVVDCHI